MDKPFELTCLFWPCANLQFDVSGNMKKASTTFGRERWVMVWVCRLTIFTSINQQYFRMNSSLFIPGQTRRRCQPRWLWPSIDRWAHQTTDVGKTIGSDSLSTLFTFHNGKIVTLTNGNEHVHCSDGEIVESGMTCRQSRAGCQNFRIEIGVGKLSFSSFG